MGHFQKEPHTSLLCEFRFAQFPHFDFKYVAPVIMNSIATLSRFRCVDELSYRPHSAGIALVFVEIK